MLLLMHKKNALFIALLPFKRFCNGIIRLQFKFAFLLYQAGYELALKFQPDLIVCDIMMPVPDGYGFLHLINKNENLKSIPFIFLTAKTERKISEGEWKWAQTIILPNLLLISNY
jgi:CheY-like chemotaxis protein